MTQAPLITFIMPAYNAEKVIRDSVTAILEQTIQNLELIVVNDGSKDSTSQVLGELAEYDHRLKVLNVENGGPAKARNQALDAADPATEYIMFSDADDKLLPDAAEKALKAAESGADLVLFGFTIKNTDGTENNYFEPNGEYTADQLGQALPNLYKANLLNQVWGKLFRADLIQKNHIRFPDYRWGEDRLFIFECLQKQKKIAVISDCLYLYIMQEGESLISGYYEKKPEICILADQKVQELCRQFRVTDESVFRYMFTKSVFSCLTNLYSPSCRLSHTEKRRYTAKIIKNEHVKARCRKVAGGIPALVVGAVLCSGNVTLNLAAARLAAVMGKVAPKLFQKMKHRK